MVTFQDVLGEESFKTYINRWYPKDKNMNITKLPIDVIPNTNPPKFRWTQTIQVMGCGVTQDCEGMLQPSVERAVETLINMAKRMLKDNAALREQVDGMAERIAAQSDILSKHAEAPLPPVHGHTHSTQVTKKGRG